MHGAIGQQGFLVRIIEFRDRWLEEIFLHDRSRNIPPDLGARLFGKLQLSDDASSDADLRIPPSNHFAKLRGNLAGRHSIRVNDRWRPIFLWDGNKSEISDLYPDKHTYS